MISAANPIVENFLNNMAQLDARMATDESQLSSGLQVQRPSDKPEVAADVVALLAEIGQNTQVQSNLAAVKMEVDSGEQALESGMNLLDSAVTLGSQASNTLTGPSSTNNSASILANIAQQLTGLQSELVGLSNTQANGKYIFSGDQDSTAAYSVDAGGVVTQIATASATRLIADSNGVPFAVARTAKDIFDNPAGSVFAAMTALQTAVAANSAAGVSTALSALKTARDQLSSQLSFYGTVQDRVKSATDLAAGVQTNRTQMLSAKRDTDMAAAASDLAQIQVERQAALMAESQVPRKSLFDYMG
jgi:flagellar hook-associated protein 3 FlgL